MRKILLSFASFFLTTQVFAHGLGYVTLPLGVGEHIVSAELLGFLDNQTGIGFQGRYTRKMGDIFALDAGFGYGTNDRNANLFIGADLEIFPDYEDQPRVSLKTNIELTDVGESNDNIKSAGKATSISFSPVVSKMLVIADMTTYPYIALPIGLNLYRKYDVYKSFAALSFGLASWLKFGGTDGIEEMNPIAFNAELRIGITKAADSALIVSAGWKLP